MVRPKLRLPDLLRFPKLGEGGVLPEADKDGYRDVPADLLQHQPGPDGEHRLEHHELVVLNVQQQHE